MAIKKQDSNNLKNKGSRANTSTRSRASQPAKDKRLSDEEKVEEAFKTLNKFKNKNNTLAQVIAAGSAHLFPDNMSVVFGPKASAALQNGDSVSTKGEAKAVTKPPFHLIAEHLLFSNGRMATVLGRFDSVASKTFGGLYQTPSVPEFLKEFSEYYDNYNGGNENSVTPSIHDVIQKHVQVNERLVDMLLDVSKQIETLS